MKLALFKEIYDKLALANGYHEILPEYPNIHENTIRGVYYRLMQTELRRRIWRFEADKIDPAILLDRFYTLYTGSFDVDAPRAAGTEGIIADMAKEFYGIPPCHLARIIVKAYCEKESQVGSPSTDTTEGAAEDEDGSNGTGPSVNASENSNQITKEDHPTPSCPTFCKISNGGNGKAKGTKQSHTKYYKDPTMIKHKGLAQNVLYCHRVDEHYSPAMDQYRTDIGLKYEEILVKHVESLGVSFLDEPAMRRMGYARTPDIVLLEPISVNGLIVKWIESKAWFGDPPSHATYLKEQYWPYYNRFGPGLVIYWFGFVEEATDSHQQKGVAVMDCFPLSESITRIQSSFIELVKECKPSTQ